MQLQGDMQPVISFKALQRARTTLEDFTCSYFPYHGLRIPQDLFRFLDVIVFVEAAIYQMDEENEALCAAGDADPGHVFPARAALLSVLQQRGLMDERIRAELDSGASYWHLERRLCRCTLQPEASGSARFTLQDALVAHEAKSFDYRVLNLLLYQLRQTPYDETLLRFLKVDEMLVDIGDDLCDYEDDVEANSFNIYRAYVHLYGRGAEMQLIQRISELEAQHARLLAELPPPLQQHYWRRHQEACTGQGADKWVFPAPILDEAGYRVEVQEPPPPVQP